MAILHRASWVVPVTSPPIAGGGVVVENDRIVAIGKFSDLKGVCSQTMDHGEGILMPGLVNAHTHLELSHCRTVDHYLQPGDMVGWVADLVAFRESYTGQDCTFKAHDCLASMSDEGIDLIVDIGNDPSFSRSDLGAKVLFFHELLGLSEKAAAYNGEILATGKSDYTCHAPYSTNKDLLLEVKKQCRGKAIIFPIHLAESHAEMEFIRTGQGDFRAFIEARGVWDNSFDPPGCTPVQYLYDLGVLDEQTLCVHCVQVDQHDIQLLKEAKAHVCLCPGSNRYLGVGIPPVVDMLEAGLTPCLGTDSLASNPQVSIWREMNILHQQFPQLASEDILAMATRNGALALGCPEYGTLSPDGVSMIFVEYKGEEPLDYLSFDLSHKQVTRCM